ncbi:MAG: PspC domain-containing protein [Parahaliea sp.]
MVYRNKHHRRGDFRKTGERSRRTVKVRKGSGWGMDLYRNTGESRIAGVAAGLADHWDVAHWVVRLMWVGAFLFTGTLAMWVYIAAWILLAPRPNRRWGEQEYAEAFGDTDVEMQYDERRHQYRPRRVFQYSEPSGVRLKRARERLDAALLRVQDMESYVTSRQYQLNKEFSKL